MPELVLKKEPGSERTVEKQVGGWRGTVIKQTKHNYILHHPDTDEPIFRVREAKYPTKDQKHELEWHEHMLALHPELEHSFEHGSRHYQSSKRGISGRDVAPSIGGHRYDEAARTGFKDKLPSSVEHHEKADENGVVHKKTITHIHDPETGEKILSFSGHHTYSDKINYHSSYLNKHGISEDVVKGIKAQGAYHLAERIHKEKGRKYSALGDVTHKGHSLHYNVTPGTSDEDASKAHEAYVRRTSPTHTIVRHSPTVFTATPQKEGYGQHHIASVAQGGRVIAHHAESQDYSSTKLDHRF